MITTETNAAEQLSPAQIDHLWDLLGGYIADHKLGKLADTCTREGLRQRDPESGEEWQLMGVYFDGPWAQVEFRHRHHPVTQQRYNASFEVNLGAA